MLPVIELRGAIPVGVQAYGLSLPEAFVFASAGNILIGVVLVYALPFLEKRVFRRIPFLAPLFTFFAERTRRRHSRKIELYAELGLFFLVAVPLPATGAWTGALAAYLFGLKQSKAALVISAGVIAAGILVSLATAGVINVL